MIFLEGLFRRISPLLKYIFSADSISLYCLQLCWCSCNWVHQVAMCCIRQTHCSLIDHSTTANGLHEFKMMVVYSSSRKNVIVYWPLKLWKWRRSWVQWWHSVFKMGKSVYEPTLPLLTGRNTDDARKKHLWTLGKTCVWLKKIAYWEIVSLAQLEHWLVFWLQ